MSHARKTVLAIAAVRTPEGRSRSRASNPVQPVADVAKALAPFGPPKQAPIGAGRAWTVLQEPKRGFHVVDHEDGSYGFVIEDAHGTELLDQADGGELNDAIRAWLDVAKGAPSRAPTAPMALGTPDGVVHLVGGVATLKVKLKATVVHLGPATPEVLAELLRGGRRMNPVGSFKDDLRRQMAKADRDRHAASMAAIEASIAALRKARGYERRKAQAACRMDVRNAFVASRQRFEAIVAEARRERDAARREAREGRASCGVANEQFLEPFSRRIRELEAQQDKERTFQRQLRQLERHGASAKKTRSTKAERKHESDDEVRYNLPAELLPLYEKIKRTLRVPAGMSRTEAVLHYAEEHPDEVLEATMEDADAVVARMVASQYG